MSKKKTRARDPKILALDLGTQVGWVLGDVRSVLAAGREDFSPGRYESGAMRFVRFRRWVEEMAAGADIVVTEEPGFVKYVQASQVLTGMYTLLVTFCEEHGIPVVTVPVSTLKRWATGKGNAKKNAMRESLRAKLAGVRMGTVTRDAVLESEHTTDAMWLYLWTLESGYA